MDPTGTRRFPTGEEDAEGRARAVSWASIIAGAAGAAALSLVLLFLGTGLGLSAASPWAMEGMSAATFGFAAIAWLSFTQLAASGVGGYLAGRLRNKWTAAHNDEVFFRDTAHGFLAWAVASLLTAVTLTSVMGSIVSGGISAGAAVAGGTANAIGSVAGAAVGSATGSPDRQNDAGETSTTIEYFVESLFRESGPANSATAAAREAQMPTPAAGAQTGEAATELRTDADQPSDLNPAARQAREPAPAVAAIPAGEVTRLFARALRTGSLPPEDERYLGRLIAQRTDLSQQEAERRASEGFQKVQTTLQEMETAAREAADKARKASAQAALWMFVALLLGAFTSSLMAVFGGRQRDNCFTPR